MIANNASAALVNLEPLVQTPNSVGSFRFDLANAKDDSELRQFSAKVEMPGAIRFSFDRSPDYLAALRVEGRKAEVLVCRENKTGRLVATGHRAIKTAFVNGLAAQLGYFSGLRVEPGARSAQLLSRGYARLRALHTHEPAQLYLTTIMEDNPQAKRVLLSNRLGLPDYHDFGRFCCMAVSLQTKDDRHPDSAVSVRCATASDGSAVVEFLNREGRSKQFFPQYSAQDFASTGGLLSNLDWKDVFLAFRGRELLGVTAAWDQRGFRRWQVTGYAPWLRLLRIPLNLVAKFRQMPTLPNPYSPLAYFVLSLVCVRDNDRGVFKTLLQELIRARQGRFTFFLAGLHERDPLLPELLIRPHVPLFSRLCVVAWEDCAKSVQELDRTRIPYLELGSL